MYLFIFFILCLLALLSHELGHAFAMRSRGIPIKRIAIGIPIPGIPTITLKKVFPGTELSLSPLLIMAFVKPEKSAEKLLNDLPHRDSALINGAGVLANFFFALLIFSIFTVSVIKPDSEPTKIFLFYSGVALISTGLWVWRDYFCRFVIPILGPLLIVTLCYIFSTGRGELVGPIGIVQEATKLKGIWEYIAYADDVSLGLGLVNCLPIFPLDGGRILSAILRDKEYFELDGAIKKWGSVAFLIFFSTVIVKDFFRLF